MGDRHRVFGVNATQDEVGLFVAVETGHDAPRPVVTVSCGGGVVDVDDAGWHSSDPGTGEHRLWWAKPTVTGLEAGRSYPVELADASGRDVASASVTTLPGPGTRRFQLVAGSCFDGGGGQAGALEHAHADLTAMSDGAPVYHLWLGDQVYVDAPWHEATRADDAREIIYDRYLATWGITGESAFADIMAASSNWYLPDDHEFWNGYPDPSWLTLFLHTLKRVTRQIWRARPTSDSKPHPASQGEWGSTAGEAYCVFATGREFDRFDESVSPPGLQRIETDDVVVVLVDTRWRRTIRKSLGDAGFMLGDDLDELVQLLETERRTVCLALPKPIIGHLPRRSVTKSDIDTGPEAYAEQYTKLWRALAARADAELPTVTVAGDVHRHAVRSAMDDRLVEVVSSPLSLLRALEPDQPVARARRVLGRISGALRGLFRSAEVRARGLATDESHAYPVFDADGNWTAASGAEQYLAPRDASGIAGIEFDATPSGGRSMVVRTVVTPPGAGAVRQSSTLRFEWVSGSGWVRT